MTLRQRVAQGSPDRQGIKGCDHGRRRGVMRQKLGAVGIAQGADGGQIRRTGRRVKPQPGQALASRIFSAASLS